MVDNKTTDQITQGIFEEYLPGFWKQTDTNLQIINSFSQELQNVYIHFNKLSLDLYLNTASGTRLDDFGLLFGLTRITGESDADYRAKLLAYYQTYLECSTDEGIINALALHFGLDPADIEIQHVKKFQTRAFVANMEAAEGWSGAGVAFDTAICYRGTRSLKFSATGATSVIATWAKSIDLSNDLISSDLETFNLWYDFDDSTKIDRIKLTFTDGTVTAVGTLTITPGAVLTQGLLNFIKKDFTNYSTIDWSSITEMTIQMDTNALTHANFDWLQMGIYDNSMIFDIHIDVPVTFNIADYLSRAPAIVNTVKAIGTYPRQFLYSIVP